MKKLLTGILFAVAALGIVSCSGGKSEAPAAPSATQTAAPAVADTGQTFVADVVRHDYAAHQVRERVWRDYVQNASGGRIKVNFLSRNAIAPSDTDLLELVRSGEVTMGSIAEQGISDVFPEIAAVAIPFMVPNSMVAARLLWQDSPFFQRVAEEFYNASNKEARIVGAHTNSFRNFYSKDPVRVPADLKKYNVKIRVQELPMIIAVWEALGASAVGLPPGDRYMAMETGLINALEGGIASVYQIGIFEIADYATLLGYMFSGNYMIVNEKWYQSLPPALQEVVKTGWAKAMWMEGAVREYFDLEELEKLVSEGNTVIVPSAAELAQWKEIAVPTARKYLEGKMDMSFIDYTEEQIKNIEKQINGMIDQIGKNY